MISFYSPPPSFFLGSGIHPAWQQPTPRSSDTNPVGNPDYIRSVYDSLGQTPPADVTVDKDNASTVETDPLRNYESTRNHTQSHAQLGTVQSVQTGGKQSQHSILADVIGFLGLSGTEGTQNQAKVDSVANAMVGDANSIGTVNTLVAKQAGLVAFDGRNNSNQAKVNTLATPLNKHGSVMFAGSGNKNDFSNIKGKSEFLTVSGSGNTNTGTLAEGVEQLVLSGNKNNTQLRIQGEVEELLQEEEAQGNHTKLEFATKAGLLAFKGSNNRNSLHLSEGSQGVAFQGSKNVNHLHNLGNQGEGASFAVLGGTQNENYYKGDGTQVLAVQGTGNRVNIETQQDTPPTTEKNTPDKLVIAGEGNIVNAKLQGGNDSIAIKKANSMTATIDGSVGEQTVTLEGEEKEWSRRTEGDTLVMSRGKQQVRLKQVEQLTFQANVDATAFTGIDKLQQG